MTLLHCSVKNFRRWLAAGKERRFHSRIADGYLCGFK
jgi:hypothetical protein